MGGKGIYFIFCKTHNFCSAAIHNCRIIVRSS